VPEAERNGIVKGYEVHNNRSGEVTIVNGTDVFYVRILLSATVAHWLSLTAFTVVGHSPPATVYIHAIAQQR